MVAQACKACKSNAGQACPLVQWASKELESQLHFSATFLILKMDIVYGSFEYAALLAIGHQLRASELFSKGDGEVNMAWIHSVASVSQ